MWMVLLAIPRASVVSGFESKAMESVANPKGEGWKAGRLEGWKAGMLEGWKAGRLEGVGVACNN